MMSEPVKAEIPGLDKAVWKRPFPPLKKKDEEDDGNRGAAYKGWGKGFTAEDLKPGKKKGVCGPGGCGCGK